MRSNKQAMALAMLAGFFCAVLIVGVAGHRPGDRMAYDEVNFHLPAIQHFLQGGSIHDYPSATTPGYHMLLAALGTLTGDAHEWPLRAGGALFTVGFLYLLARVACQPGKPQGAWLALPMLSSMYVITAGAWLLPDNLAWLTVLLALWLATQSHWHGPHVLAGAVVCAVAIFVRQSNAWVLAPLLAAVWLGPGRGWSAATKVLIAAWIAVPSLALLAYLFVTWHGLVPPSFQARHQSFNPVATAWFLVQFAVVGLFYLPLVRGLLKQVVHDGLLQRWVCAGALIGLIAAVAMPCTYDVDAGRWSGLWQVVKATPAVMERSLLVTLAAVFGGALVALLLSQLAPLIRWVVLVAILSFCASSSTNRLLFDRYFMGFVFISLALLLGHSRTRLAWDKLSMASIATLFLVNLGVLGGKLQVGALMSVGR